MRLRTIAAKSVAVLGISIELRATSRWEFDDAQSRQRLVGPLALCPQCHDVKHFGRANENSRGADAKLHLCEVNDWSIADADSCWKELHR